MAIERTVCVADCETNPFREGFPVFPFVWGFYDGSTYHQFWDDIKTGKSCSELFLDFLERLDDPCIIYAHNGGKFDWLFLVKHLRGQLKVIGTRIVKARLGIHELRDSFANIPVPLKDFGNKLEFDYTICEPGQREKKHNRSMITEYLKQDCVGLYGAIVRYRNMFGDTLTMASAAMQQLNGVCTGSPKSKIYERLSPQQDKSLRPFYYGGRVQCFRYGILDGPWKVFDVTSMYPSVMRDYAHPISNVFVTQTRNCKITEDTDFAIIDATARGIGCLPLRTKTGLAFPTGRHAFTATGAEIRRAIALDLLKIHEIHQTITATDRVCFKSFIDTFFRLRMDAKSRKDVAEILFYKLVMNSAYGKFAIQPEKYEDMVCLPDGELPKGDVLYQDDIMCIVPHDAMPDGERCTCVPCNRRHYAWRFEAKMNGVTIWKKPISHHEKAFANVACGASITGFARAKLMHGLFCADTPIYCDTDAIMCRNLEGVEHGLELGQWQYEVGGNTAAIAGKKLYALFGDESADHSLQAKRLASYGDANCVKLASKGVRLSADEIRRVASGAVVEYTQQAPIIKLDGSQIPLKREIRMTGNVLDGKCA